MVATPGLINRLFDANARDIARYMDVVKRINALEADLEKATDEDMRARTEALRERVQSQYKSKLEAAQSSWTHLNQQERREADRRIYDGILDELLPEAFALVREASKRTLGLRHFDVQMVGGIALHDGRIAEMKTGEGKTLVATCPLYLNALLGKGAHLVTVNDYLSKRDAVWNGPIYHLLGMSVGIIQSQTAESGPEGPSYVFDPSYRGTDAREDSCRPVTRNEAYGCDITYGTNNEFGFDYLRDNMEFTREELRQRELHYAIVDEVDSILIDEARTPLIISGMVEQATDDYDRVDRVVAQMKRGVDDPKTDKDNPDADKLNPNIHYVVDEKQKTATITDAGVAFAEKMLGVENLADDNRMMHYVSSALKSHGVFRKDIDYVVKDQGEGPEIIIVDENTGRLMFGRRYSDGLHQAIEAKEHVEIKHESQTLATITFQNYFRVYSKLAGMTGTAKTEEDEFRKIYALDVVQVPTNKPMVRLDQPDVFYKSEEHKLRGIASEILRLYCKQQPVLVGTRSIEMSERVSARVQPASLATLGMVEVARMQLERSKSLSGDRKKEGVALLNKPLTELSVVALRPLLKELQVDSDPLSPDNMNNMAQVFGVDDAGLDFLEEALTHGIPHNILNAKYHEQEAVVIAEAGRKGSVTIATNMAGRGVDILLGGKHIDQELPPVDGGPNALAAATEEGSGADGAGENGENGDTEPAEPGFRRLGRPRVLDAVTTGALTDEEHKRAASDVCAMGGLYILGTERHESRRIDNQLRGRSGRQGDPGESRFFVSLEDELWRLFGDRTKHWMLRSWEEHLSMDAKILSPMIQRAQKKVEEHYFEMRKHVLDYDDVMNRQRELIYRERRSVLEGADLRETILHYITMAIQSAVNTYTPGEVSAADWDIEQMFRELDDLFMLQPAVTQEDLNGKSRDDMAEFLTNHVTRVYQAREEELEQLGGPFSMREIERMLALRAINTRWMEHLANMDYLREGIGLRGYEQKDPLLIYQKEAFDEFERMQQLIQDDIVRGVFRGQFLLQPPMPMAAPIPLPASMPRYAPMLDLDGPGLTTNLDAVGNGRAGRERVPAGWKGGRNDPCWCGSGVKYKRCHGKT